MTTEWKIGTDYAARSTPRPFAQTTEVELVDDAFTVECCVGSGYMRESTSATILVRVIVALLRNAGYTVTQSEREEPK